MACFSKSREGDYSSSNQILCLSWLRVSEGLYLQDLTGSSLRKAPLSPALGVFQDDLEEVVEAKGTVVWRMMPSLIPQWVCELICCDGKQRPFQQQLVLLLLVVVSNTSHALETNSTHWSWASWLCSSTALWVCFLTFMPLSSPSPTVSTVLSLVDCNIGSDCFSFPSLFPAVTESVAIKF